MAEAAEELPRKQKLLRKSKLEISFASFPFSFLVVTHHQEKSSDKNHGPETKQGDKRPVDYLFHCGLPHIMRVFRSFAKSSGLRQISGGVLCALVGPQNCHWPSNLVLGGACAHPSRIKNVVNSTSIFRIYRSRKRLEVGGDVSVHLRFLNGCLKRHQQLDEVGQRFEKQPN